MDSAEVRSMGAPVAFGPQALMSSRTSIVELPLIGVHPIFTLQVA